MKQYIILHKVDGKPAFDVAHRLESDEEMWIVSTTGHRAYPYKNWPVESVFGGLHVGENYDLILPDGWPEHYQPAERATAKKGTGLNIMDFIKMPQPVIKLRRRI
jgi:hypothetical protein